MAMVRDHHSPTKSFEIILDEYYQEQEIRPKAARRGRILVWWILLPIVVLLVAYRVWQLQMGRL